MNKYVLRNANNIAPVSTKNDVGSKKGFLRNQQCFSTITQAAHGSLKVGKKGDQHKAMEGSYFIESGGLVFSINDDHLLCKKGDFIIVPAASEHYIEAITDISFIVPLGEWEKNPRLQAKTLVCLRYGKV